MKLNKDIFVLHSMYTGPHRSSYKFNYPIGSDWWTIVQIVRSSICELSKAEILETLQAINRLNGDPKTVRYSVNDTVFSALTSAGLIKYDRKKNGYDIGHMYYSFNESLKRSIDRYMFVMSQK